MTPELKKEIVLKELTKIITQRPMILVWMTFVFGSYWHPDYIAMYSAN